MQAKQVEESLFFIDQRKSGTHVWNEQILKKNNFTCLLLYQFAAILSQKYQAFPAVVAFNQGLPIFHFLF
jgi:hypothetical protein